MTNPWIICPKPNPKAYLRLFCFPYAGAGASVFRTWANQFPLDIEVCAIQLPGRESRLKESCFTNLETLIDILIPALIPYLDRPFAFFGHSLGALICFTAARKLRQLRHITPLHLFISARQAPQLPSEKPPIHHLPKSEFLQELRSYNGTPEVVLQNIELMDLFLPILRADLTINETYKYTLEAPLDCSISAFGGLQDPLVSRDSLAAWCAQTSRSFNLRLFPGNHFFIKSQQEVLIEVISAQLRVGIREVE